MHVADHRVTAVVCHNRAQTWASNMECANAHEVRNPAGCCLPGMWPALRILVGHA